MRSLNRWHISQKLLALAPFPRRWRRCNPSTTASGSWTSSRSSTTSALVNEAAASSQSLQVQAARLAEVAQRFRLRETVLPPERGELPRLAAAE